MGVRMSKTKQREYRGDAEERARNKRINAEQEAKRNSEEMVQKLLILGAGESGKSTLFKQMISLYGDGFSEQDRLHLRKTVYGNMISAMQTLLEQSDILGGECALPADAAELKSTALGYGTSIKVDSAVAEVLSNLWEHPSGALKKVWERRSGFQIIDTAGYFFDKAREVGDAEYVPSFDDILRTRTRTTGIVETSFEIQKNKFRMYDVGGQRNERKKWIHCFENVTAIIYVAALSGFDQMCFEDEKTNRMHESLTVFNNTINSEYFQDTSIILFLNKRDLFEEKIKRVPLTVAFEDYAGDPHSYDECIEYIQEQYENLNQRPEAKMIYPHVTCATDTSNIDHVFNAVKDTIINKGLADAGLL